MIGRPAASLPTGAGRRWHAAVVLIALWTCFLNPAKAQLKPAEKKAEPVAETPETKLPPEIEKKLANVTDKLTKLLRAHLDAQTKKEVEEITKAAGLNAEQVTLLQPAAKDAEDKTVDEASAKLRKTFREQYDRSPAQFVKELAESAAQFDAILAQDPTGAFFDQMLVDCTAPMEQAGWKLALQHTLTPAQTVALEKVQSQRKQSLEGKFGDYLRRQADRVSEQEQRVMRTETDHIAHALNLSKDRTEKLAALAKSAVDKAVEASSKKIEQQLLAMDESQRNMMIKQGGSFGTEEDDLPDKQPVWVEGLVALLSDDERALLKKNEQDHKQRRIRALGMVFVELLDEKVAFTASQRERLQPLAEHAVLEQPNFFPTSKQIYYNNNLNPSAFYRAAEKLPAEQVKAILTPEQWRHWREACQTPNESSDDDEVETVAAQKPKVEPTPTPTPSTEPEEVERAISDYVNAKTASERKRLLDTMTLKAEDAARVAMLSLPTAERLQTAACGAAEENLTAWKRWSEDTNRSQVGEVRPENVRQKLAGIEFYNFQRPTGTKPDELPIWTKILKTELTDEQRAAWKKELDLRGAYRDEAIAAIVMAEFDRTTTLTGEQWAIIQPKLADAIKEYSSDFESYFSYSNDTPWYLGYVICLPIAGIPEDELKAILSKDQWQDWSGSNQFNIVSSYWQNISANHERKAKVKKAQ